MAPSVAYWTSALFPEMEAIAGEVALLRRHFRRSIAWGVSPSRWLQMSWRRGFGVHPRFQLAFRTATWFLQRAFRVNHIFGGLGDWFHLKAVSKHPTVLTVAVESGVCERLLLERVDRFAVEWPAAREQLTAMGIEPRRVDLVLPPVDLARFAPGESSDYPPTVLFASSPDRVDWLEARGVPLLLDTAARLPNIRFRLLWRPWGESYEWVHTQVKKRELRNVELHLKKVVDMAFEYRRADVTITPFTDMSRCKAMPNSLLESLACGTPVVLTNDVGLADIVRNGECGVVASPMVDSLCEAIESAMANRLQMSMKARKTAERWFSSDQFVRNYRRIYSQIL